MTWSVLINWDGRRWSFDNVDLEEIEDIDIRSRIPRYTPRRFRLELPMGDTAAYVADGHMIATMEVTLAFGDEVRCTSPVQTIRPGRRGENTYLEVAENPIADTSSLPPSGRMTKRLVNWRRTRANVEYWWQNERRRREFQQVPLDPLSDDQVFYDDTFDASEYDSEQFQDFSVAEYDERTEGVLYPLIVNQPGVSGVPGSVATVLNEADDYTMVAGHETTLGTVTVVQFDQDDNRTTHTMTTEHLTTTEGRTITVVQGLPMTHDRRFRHFVVWNGTARGLPGDPSSLVPFLISQARGVRVDLASVVQACRRLDGRYRFDGSVDAPTSAFDLLMTHILPLLPLVPVDTPLGLGLVPISLRPTENDIRAHIVAGTDLIPVDERETFKRDENVTNVWRVRYGANRNTKKFTERVIVGPRAHGMARRSVSIFGRREDVIKTHWVYDEGTARRVATAMCDRFALPPIRYRYQANPAAHGSEGKLPMVPGEVYRITDPSRSLDAAVMQVVRRRRRGAGLEITLDLVQRRN